MDEDKPSKPRCVIKQFCPQAQGTDNAQKAAELFEQEMDRFLVELASCQSSEIKRYIFGKVVRASCSLVFNQYERKL